MKAAAILKDKLREKRPVLGLLASFPFWPGLVEVAINAGLDYLVIDLEHMTHDAPTVGQACAIGRRADFAVLRSAIERIRDAGRAAGKNTWVVGNAPEMIRQGFNFICIAEATMQLQGTLKTMVSQAAAGAA